MSNKSKASQKTHEVQHVQAQSRHTRYLVASGAGILLFGLVLLFILSQNTVPSDFVPQVKGAPSIAVVSEEVIDHGDVVVNRFITSSFDVQNVGDETLVIVTPLVKVHEGCCPPQATINKQQLRPGEIATISMNYTMHPGMDGPHDLRIHVQSTDPANPEIELIALSNWVSA